MKTSHLIAGASAVLLLATMVGHFFLQVANVGIAGSTSLFLLFWVWLWMATTEQVDEDNARYDAKIARRSRFVEYIEGDPEEETGRRVRLTLRDEERGLEMVAREDGCVDLARWYTFADGSRNYDMDEYLHVCSLSDLGRDLLFLQVMAQQVFGEDWGR